MVKAVVIADDLTGAADTGLQFHSHGLSAGVLLAGDRLGTRTAGLLPDAAGEPWAVVVLSTETRNRSEEDAGAALAEVGAGLARTLRAGAGAPPPLLYKKIDSTLRGWVGQELRALLDRLPAYTAWIAPAYPQQGRHMRAGWYTVHGRPLHETEFAGDVRGGRDDSRVQALLESQMRERIAFVAHDSLAHGPDAVAEQVRRSGRRAVLFDAATGDDLNRIVAAGARTGAPILWVGSAGLADPLAGRLPAGVGPQPWSPPRSPVVIVSGSRSPATLRQIAFLRARVALHHRTVDPARSDSVARAPAAAGHTLLTLPEGKSGHSLSLASHLGAEAARVIADTGARRLILTGGDTAAATCRFLKADALEIVDQVEAGVPVSRLRGGVADGAMAVTKAGGFGAEASLYHAFCRLLKEGEER